jgi:non-homologous end joining protein Ku
MGAMKARVGLTPITDKEAELFMRAKNLINSEASAITPQEKIDKMNIKLSDFIAEKLKMYDEKWKAEKNFKHIASDMALSAESMK